MRYCRIPTETSYDRLMASHPGLSFPHFFDEYVDTSSYITAVCPKHGKFKSTYGSMYHNQTGCRKCGDIRIGNYRRVAANDAYEKLLIARSDVTPFPYFFDEYEDTRSYISATCPKHGLFKIGFSNLYHGNRGCQICAKERGNAAIRTDPDEALRRLKSTHPQYEFPHALSEYKNSDSYITVICPKHGEFKSAYTSLYHIKTGCIKCGFERTANHCRLDIEYVIEQLKLTHGDKLSFPKARWEYTSGRDKLTAICPKHGKFKATYANLVNNKTGCIKCGYERVAEFNRIDKAEALSRLVEIHPTLTFPYFDKEYKDTSSFITLKCEKHGERKSQYSNMYSNKVGCAKCGREQVMNVPGFPELADYKRYHCRLLITDNATEGIHGELQVRCKFCEELFTPSLSEVLQRIKAINTLGYGERNFYCSDDCKDKCSVYNAKSDTHILAQNITDYEAKVKLARNCQLETKRVLRQHQMDQYGYHFCEKCGKVVDNPELHHTIEVAKDPSGAITIAGQMLVCNECHKEFTRICR